MTSVSIIGIGQTPVAEHWERDIRSLAAEAAHAALEDAGLSTVDAVYVANTYGAAISSQAQLGPLIADYAGLRGVEAMTVEAGEAAGGAALRVAFLAVASGQVETAMVVGVEKATDMIGPARVAARGVTLDADYESIHGGTLAATAGLLMRRYLYEHGVELSAFENFSINAHANGSRNANAMYRNQIRPGGFVRAPMVSDPVNLFDSAPDGDGAAALIVTTAERAQDLVPKPIAVLASAVATDSLALQDRADMLRFTAVERAVDMVLRRASISRDDIEVFELSDVFTVVSALTLEAAGYAPRGTGWKLAADNDIALNGRIPISTFGGHKSRGNPVGATGVYQTVEAVLQLRGTAGANQVANARTAMILSMGGLGASVVTHVLQA